MMERSGCRFNVSSCQVSLSDILGLQNQPVCEEEAWALCYQLCSLLEQNFSGHLGESYQTWKTFKLPGPGGILFSSDGSLSLRMDSTKIDGQFIMETEDQAVDYVGRLMYSCLDWSLGADVERELNETLELFVCQMTKVNARLDERTLQPICTISEVLQVCEERLYSPNQAAQHYRNVCSTLYSHTVELCRYVQIIQQTRESLQKMIVESETSLLPNVTTNWELAWKHLVEELSRGVILRPPKEKLNTSCAPVPADTSPFSQLLQDIQLRRYKLRKTMGIVHRKSDPHQVMLNLIRAGPKLRPVSERKVTSRPLHPKQEAGLHELLMQEIRSTDRVKLLSSSKRRRSCRVDSACSSSNCLKPIHEYYSNEDSSFFMNPVLNPSQQEMPSQGGGCKGSSPSTEHSIAGLVEGNLKFFPALSSTPVSPVPESRLSKGKRRARSFASNREPYQLEMRSKVPAPMTIASVITMHYSKEGKLKTMSCDMLRNWRVCCCCTRRSLYFTWHNSCSLCNKVVCPECCVEMRLPFKWCVNLPLSFFKKIVLNKEIEQSQRNFWSERWSWDSSWIPLVLESRLPSSLTLHSLAMRDWHSQDICVGCQSLLLEAFDSLQSHCPIRDPQEI